MNLRGRNKVSAEFSMSSMTDIVFLLLVFFLLTSPSITPDALDLILPKINGFVVLETIKKDKKTKDIPVILLTNLSQKADVEKGLALGAVDYLIKAHFMPSEVVTKIKGLIK